MNLHAEAPLGQWVAADFRRAAVFERFGLDYCCGGQQPLSAACAERGLATDVVLEALENLPPTEATLPDFSDWPLDLLIDYIEKKHHRFVRENLPPPTGQSGKAGGRTWATPP